MKKSNQNNFLFLLLTGLLALGLVSTNLKLNDLIAEDTVEQSAFDVYADLQEAATNFNARALMVAGDLVVEGQDGGVTFGAEKEASSSLVTRIMSPDSHSFKMIISRMEEADRKEFLADFFKNYIKNANGYRTYKDKEGMVVDLATDVTDIEGNAKLIDLEPFRSIDFENVSVEILDQKFDEWLAMTDDRPFTFIKPSVRTNLYLGKLPGMKGQTKINGSQIYFRSWKPNFGLAQKYISDAHNHGGANGAGWEVNFIPQSSYGEFEEMVMWFRKTLENVGKLFQAPGHQRMVFRRHPNLDEARLAETYRMIQALIVLDGIQGNTGIEFASFKAVHNDSSIEGLNNGRGVIRLEGDRWAPDTHGVEFRAGTKDIRSARFYQTVLAARVATNDFSGLSQIADYPLYEGYNMELGLGQRFDLDESVVNSALENLRRAGLNLGYCVPLYSWEHPNLPWLSDTKKVFLKSLSKDFLTQVAALEGNNVKADVKRLMRTWVRTSRLGEEVRNYLKPRRMPELTGDYLKFVIPEGRPIVANPVDVNSIDLGIEYSGKFPLALEAEYSADRLADNKKAWMQTRVDLTIEERKAVINKVATDLLKELGGEGEPTLVEDAGGHGHGLEIAYEIRDPKNRKWVVEWDGIGRSYTGQGEIIEESVRGGSIELVTPKFVPEAEEMAAVFKAFESNNILPSIKSGGGHINVDLAPFDGNPKALGRFMALFHEHRGIISLMFQYVNRLKSAEPIAIDSDFAKSLANFEGSEEDLKKLLYNNQYFNTRYGRKTRYNQLEMSAYFQDVIPDQFITDDFDINSPTDPWRRTFRVNPKIRKAEFRLFNAPRDPMESALQIKLVRAMLSKALNEEGDLSGVVQKVDHISYLKNPADAYGDLEKLCEDLGLDVNEFRPAVAEGLSDTDLATRSAFFETIDQKLRFHPKQIGWGEAVAARSAEDALNSEGRQWIPSEVDDLNNMTHAQRLQAAEYSERQRASVIPSREIPGDFTRGESCINAINALL